MQTYVKKWGIEVEAEAVRPGIWRRRDAGYLARVQVRHPQTEKSIGRIKTLPSLQEAQAWQVDERRQIAATGEENPRRRVTFLSYANSCVKQKIANGEINSLSTKQVLLSALDRHILPTFGDMYLDKIRTADVRAWFGALTERVGTGEIKPRTANHLLCIFKSILSCAIKDDLIDESPAARISLISVVRCRTYTREQPNNFDPADLPSLWEYLSTKKPKWYALIVLGVVYGLRPSSLRPLRFRGPESDVKWDEKVILIRRSHSRRQEVMDSTKTGQDLELPIDDAVLEILRRHVERYAQPGCDLLFPGQRGRLMSTGAIAYRFSVVEKAVGKGRHITPRAMRRTFYGVAGRTSAQDHMVRSITGHKTPRMADVYRMTQLDEQRGVMGQIVDLAAVRSERNSERARPEESGPTGHRREIGQSDEISVLL